jgi:putative transposase
MLNKTRHATYDIKIHIIFVTKYRKRIFTSEMLDLIGKTINSLLTANGCKLIEYNGEADHIHMLVSIHPIVAVSKLVNVLKGVSSRNIRKAYPQLTTIHYGANVGLWSRAYYASSVGGVTLEKLKKYIQTQNHPL